MNTALSCSPSEPQELVGAIQSVQIPASAPFIPLAANLPHTFGDFRHYRHRRIGCLVYFRHVVAARIVVGPLGRENLAVPHDDAQKVLEAVDDLWFSVGVWRHRDHLWLWGAAARRSSESRSISSSVSRTLRRLSGLVR